ncbi:MAG: hypothetical protein GY946_09980 [bacterium]|nr:hypothetical protein [bacterium]
MGRTLRFFGLALLLATRTLATGCNPRPPHIEIPDFEDSQVVGLTIWRVDAGQPEDVAAITFGSFSTYDLGTGIVEVIEYNVTQIDGTELTLFTEVTRDASKPGGIEVHLLFPKGTSSGFFKVSTFNAIGSSPLSEEQTYLL